MLLKALLKGYNSSRMKLNILSEIRHKIGGKITGFRAGQDNSVEFTVELKNGYKIFVTRIAGLVSEPPYYTFWITYGNDVAGSFIGAETCSEQEFLPCLKAISQFK